MNTTPLQDAVHQQFGAAIDSLQGAIEACPDGLWTDGEQWKQPWYIAFHALFWLDLYLSESALDYDPPPPFTKGELEPDQFPERPYSKAELVQWLKVSRAALQRRVASIGSDPEARRPCKLHWGTMQAAELLLYNLRHVQHHVAQLNLLIRQAAAEPAPWRMRADGLPGR